MSLDIYELKKIEENKCKGCAVCHSKKTGKWNTSGAMGSTDSLYYCRECGTVRIWL